MRYLGVEIVQDKYFGVHTSAVTCGAYLGSDDIKKDIRKKVLPTYKPTKTLEWLEDQTGIKWEYRTNGFLVHSTYPLLIEYDVQCQGCWIMKNGVNVLGNYESFEPMTPREFIEKIAKGEWV